MLQTVLLFDRQLGGENPDLPPSLRYWPEDKLLPKTLHRNASLDTTVTCSANHRILVHLPLCVFEVVSECFTTRMEKLDCSQRMKMAAPFLLISNRKSCYILPSGPFQCASLHLRTEVQANISEGALPWRRYVL